MKTDKRIIIAGLFFLLIIIVASALGSYTNVTNIINGSSNGTTDLSNYYTKSESTFYNTSKQFSCPAGQFYNTADATNLTCATPGGSAGQYWNYTVPFFEVVYLENQNAYLGIGTDNPTSKVQINGVLTLAEEDLGYYIRHSITSSSTDKILGTITTSATNTDYDDGIGDISLATNGGNVGIGTGYTSPTEKLVVDGNISILTGTLYLDSQKGSNPILTIDSNGKVSAVANWTSGGSSNVTNNIYYNMRKGRQMFYDDFGYYATARTNGVGICAAVSSGTAAQVTAEPYFGVVRFSDSTTANGGFYCASNTDTVYITGGENLTFRFKVTTGATNVHHFGFSDSATIAMGTDYCEMYITDLKLQGTCKNNAGPTNTSTTYTLTTATWYVGRIEAITNANVQFSLWNAGMTSLLWNSSITSNIPNTTARQMRVMFGSYESTTGAAAIRSYIDFIDFWKSNEVQFS